MSGELSTGDYVTGLAWLTVLVATTGAASVIIVRRRLAHLPVSAAALAGAIVFFGLIVAVHVVPLALGLLSRAAVTICAVAVVAGAAALPAKAADGEPISPGRESRTSVAIAVIAALGLTAWLLAAASGRFPNPIVATDVASFDLPLIARWLQSGSLWEFNEFVPLASHGSYPHHGVVAMLAVVLPWESDFAARVVPCLSLPFAGLAVFALSRELGAARSTATTMAVAGLALPIVGESTLDLAMPDALLYACVVGGVLFLVRHARTAWTEDLCMAGVALGLALGTKWYGLSCVAVVLVVWGVGSLTARNGVRVVATRGAVLLVLIGLVGGIWLVRNWVAYDNPLYPLDISPVGIELFDSPPDPLRERAGDSLAERLGDPGEFGSDLLPVLRDALGVPGALLLAAAIIAIPAGWVWARRRADPSAWPVVAVAVAALGIVAAYLVTPYTAGPEGSTTLALVNSRYVVPGLMLGAACAAVLATWAGRWRIAVELGALVAIVAGLSESASVERGRVVVAGIALLILAAVAYRMAERLTAIARGPSRRALVAAAAVAALIAAAIAGGRLQQKFAEQRLTQDAVLAQVLAEAEPGSSVGLAGIWTGDGPPPVLAAFGPELANDVAYVGRVENDQLRQLRTADEFRRALESGGYDYLIVGRSRLASNRADEWARELGFDEALASPRFRLYRAPF